LLGLGKKTRVYHLWKKGQATEEEYRGLIRACRGEIRKAKAQLQPRLATVARDNKKCFYKYMHNKKRGKESLHPLLDARGKIATKHEEKAEVVNAFFALVFNSQTDYIQDFQPTELEDREGEQNRLSIIQQEAVNELLCHLDTYNSMGPDGIHQRVLRELAKELAKPLSISYQQSWLRREVPDGWRFAGVTPIYKKGWKEDYQEPRACQPDLGAEQDYGVIHSECAYRACEGHPGDQAQPAWVHERQVLLDQPDLLLRPGDLPSG